MNDTTAKILANYSSDTPGTRANLYRLLNTGALAGTGKMIILPVDQGFEHGPGRSHAMNPASYDPNYHAQLAVDAGLSAFAAPLGMIQVVASEYAGQVPLILKMNSSMSWAENKDQAVYGTVEDALALGCAAIGFTIYPGSNYQFEMMEEFTKLSRQAKANGLAVILWSYARGAKLNAEAETSLDVIAYAAHIAAQLGANIIKVKLPSDNLAQAEAKKVYEENNVPRDTMAKRVAHVMQSTFGQRLVVFSGGAAKGLDAVLAETQAIKDGKGNGSIIGRNSFQRPRKDALDLFDKMIKIYRG